MQNTDNTYSLTRHGALLRRMQQDTTLNRAHVDDIVSFLAGAGSLPDMERKTAHNIAVAMTVSLDWTRAHLWYEEIFECGNAMHPLDRYTLTGSTFISQRLGAAGFLQFSTAPSAVLVYRRVPTIAQLLRERELIGLPRHGDIRIGQDAATGALLLPLKEGQPEKWTVRVFDSTEINKRVSRTLMSAVLFGKQEEWSMDAAHPQVRVVFADPTANQPRPPNTYASRDGDGVVFYAPAPTKAAQDAPNVVGVDPGNEDKGATVLLRRESDGTFTVDPTTNPNSPLVRAEVGWRDTMGTMPSYVRDVYQLPVHQGGELRIGVVSQWDAARVMLWLGKPAKITETPPDIKGVRFVPIYTRNAQMPDYRRGDIFRRDGTYFTLDDREAGTFRTFSGNRTTGAHGMGWFNRPKIGDVWKMPGSEACWVIRKDPARALYVPDSYSVPVGNVLTALQERTRKMVNVAPEDVRILAGDPKDVINLDVTDPVVPLKGVGYWIDEHGRLRVEFGSHGNHPAIRAKNQSTFAWFLSDALYAGGDLDWQEDGFSLRNIHWRMTE